MPIFKLTDLGAEVMYTLWCFDVDAFLEQYDEASMCPHIFASFHCSPGKWARMLDEGKDISVWDLLMHMERTFGNKHDYDAMIRTLYEVQQITDYAPTSMMPLALPWQSCLRESRPTPHLTTYTRFKKLEAGQLAHVRQYTPSSEAYKDKQRCYIVLTGWVAALEEEGSALSDQVTREDFESEVEVVGGINVHLAQVMS